MNENSKWIWAERDSFNTYNDTIIAIRRFRADAPKTAQIKITADSCYRLFVNGVWVSGGPARAWPESYNYDVFDIAHLIQDGENEVQVVARYFGCGTFHAIVQQAGLLAQIEIGRRDGSLDVICTDKTWLVSDGAPWVRNTPKISIQMEPAELYDATRESALEFRNAVEICRSFEGPWKKLKERPVEYLTLQERPFQRFVKASRVSDPPLSFSLAHTRLMNPGLIEANGRVFSPFGMATVLVMHSAGEVSFESSPFDRGYFKIAVDGKLLDEGRPIVLEEGPHFILGFARNILNNDKTISLSLSGSDRFVLQNPLAADHANPWTYLPLRKYAFVQDDMVWRWFAEPLSEGKDRAYEQDSDELLATIQRVEDFEERFAGIAENLPFDEMFVVDSYLDFFGRDELEDLSGRIDAPEALLRDDESWTTVLPCGGPVELIYDLGEQNCGYTGFDLACDGGVVVDVFAVEYIHPNGMVQFTSNNRNGFRYVARQGANCYTSMKRRSGRYVFITLRNAQNAVRIRNVKLIESTYPVAESCIFSCSDERLNRITEISARTLKLCMEDVYTDCPLYEQTLWVGDLRNEALYGYYAFGATDIAKNSLLLAAQSSSRYDMIGSQVPSCWDMILPAWSFLWGIAAWEYFWYTGDQAFLEVLYPHVVKNILSAEKLMTDQGLFSAPYWNLFDWAKIDQEHQTVFHNNMLLVGALHAAILCAKQLNDSENEARFRTLAQRLTDSINQFWDEDRKTYPDSLDAKGRVSPSSSQHTSFLALLYDVVEPEHVEDALENILHPPDEMIRVGSPFAIMYLYEALEKCGHPECLMKSIMEAYGPMLDAGATTVWESYPQGSLAYDEFPTRSHCHGWSASPMYFFQRIILGVRQTGPGCVSFEISPRLCGLSQASGTIKTPQGDLEVSWALDRDALSVLWAAPPGVNVSFKKNGSLESCRITLSHGWRNNDEAESDCVVESVVAGQRFSRRIDG